MKATSKYDKHIVALNETLRPLTDKQKEWFENKTHWNYGTKHYSSIVCLECNHKWKADFIKSRTTVKCPSCSKRLRQYPNKPWMHADSHGVLLDRVGKIQVLRVIFVRKHMYKDKYPDFQVHEVMSKWFDPDTKKVTLLSKGMNGMMGSYQGGWNLNSDVSLKKPHNIMSDHKSTIYTEAYYPSKRIPKEIKRLGFTTRDIKRIPIDHLLTGLVQSSRVETFMKFGMYDFLKKEVYHPMSDVHWSALKICMKNDYQIKDAGDWMDYIDLLSYFEKDTNSPRWICPSDFHKAHQRLVKRKNKIEKKEREERQRKNLIEQKEQALREAGKYIERTQKFYELMFKERGITISVMKTVEEFMTEMVIPLSLNISS